MPIRVKVTFRPPSGRRHSDRRIAQVLVFGYLPSHGEDVISSFTHIFVFMLTTFIIIITIIILFPHSFFIVCTGIRMG